MSGYLLTGVFILTCIALGGCAADKPAKPQAKAAAPPPPPPPASLSQIKDDLVKARAQLDTTTDTITALSKSGTADVQANYDKFAVEFTKLQSQADACRARANDLKMRTQAYFDTWNKQAEVQNPDLRRRATEQRAEAERTFSTIKSEIELAKLSYEPYVSQLKDIQSYLKENKTPAAVATVSDLTSKATTNSAEVAKHLDAVITGINKIMAASGEANPAAATPAASPAVPAK
jgi:hypothetical protein